MRALFTTHIRFRILFVVVLLFYLPAFAADIWVTNKTQFTAAMSVVQPGDVIIWKNGTNVDLGTISFEPVSQGTAVQPILLRAETPGGVVFRGNSQLQLGGHYLVVSGFRFDNTGFSFADTSTAVWVIQTRAHSDLTRHAYNCRVTDCAIINYDNPASTANSKWLEWYGATNRFDHNFVSGKRTQGAVFIVELSDQVNNIEAHHAIDHNVFADRTPGALGNEYETVRVGTSSVSDENARVRVESNYFYRCSGEAEFVSNKSCENTYRYNMFVECAGSLTLRHGRGCLVEGNVFLGNNVTNSGGIRVVNQDHVIINNYLQDLAGTDYQAALAVMDGTAWTPPASSPDLSGSYVQVKNAVIAHNTIVNAADAVNYGVGKGGSGRTTPPREFTMAANIIVSTNAPLFTLTDTPVNLTNLNNIVWGAASGLAADPELMVTNPLLTADALGFFRPATNSPAIGAAGTEFLLPGNLLDLDGFLRPLTGRDIGADQSGAGLWPVAPLTAAEVGPTWMQPAGLNPNLPPGGNFDLSHWKLTLPVDANGTNVGNAIEKSAAQLVAGYTNASYFYTGTDGAMVFWCPANGATTSGSSYPRSELRELLDPNNDNINWTAYGTHTLDAQCKVTRIPGTKKVIIGQIHSFSGAARPLIKLQFNNGVVEALVKNSPNADTDTKYSFQNVGLSNSITYRIKVVDGLLTLTVNNSNQTVNFFQTDPAWTNQTFYFKAGDYCQDNTNNSEVGAGVSFYALTVSHVFSSVPTIDTQPVSQTNTVGSSVTFNVSASGAAPLSYQWRFQATNLLTGATNAALTLSNIQLTNAGNYTVVVANSSGSVTSAVATLTVTNSPPRITTQPTPANLTLVEGQTALFTVVAGGTPPLSYQWCFNTNTVLLNATNAPFTLNNVHTNDTGAYTVIITNAYGAVTSAVAILTVNPVPPVNTNACSWDATTGTAGVQDGTGTWSTTNANWLLGGTGSDVVWDNGGLNDAVFGGGSSGTAGNVTIPTGNTINVHNLTFNAPNAGSYTIAAKTATNCVLNFSNTPIITVASGVGASISTIISGTGFAKEGGGTLTLAGSTGASNIYSGLVTVNGGTLVVQKGSDGIECITAGGVQVNVGAILQLPKKDQINDAATVTCSGGTIQFISAGGDTFASLVVNGGLVTNSDTGTSRTFTMTTAIDVRSGQIAGNTTKNMVLAGAVGLTKTTAGTVILGPGTANTYTGPTLIGEGQLVVAATNAIPSGSGKGNVALEAALDLNGFSIGINGLNGAASGIISNSSAGTVTFTIGNNAGGGTFNGTIADGNGTVAVTKTGSGVEIFGGTNTYTGTTTISGGTLALGARRSIFNSTRISLGSSGTLNVSAAGLELGASQTLAGSGAVAGSVVMDAGAKIQPGTNALKLTVSGNLTLNDNVVVVDLGGATLTNGIYRLIDYSGSRTGSFNATPTILNGSVTGTATIDHGTTNQINLIVSSALPTAPVIGSVILSSANLILSGSGGTYGRTYYVLMSTNLILSKANWPRIATNTFDLGGSFSFTNVMDSTQAGRFFQIMTP